MVARRASEGLREVRRLIPSCTWRRPGCLRACIRPCPFWPTLGPPRGEGEPLVAAFLLLRASNRAQVRFVSQVPRWRWPSPLLPGSRAPHRAASFSSLLGVGVPCDCEIPSRQRPRWLVVPWRVLRRRVVRPVLATVTLGLTPRRLPHPLCASEAPLTFHVSHRRGALVSSARDKRLVGCMPLRITPAHHSALAGPRRAAAPPSRATS